MSLLRSEVVRHRDLEKLGVFYPWEIDRHDIPSRVSVARRLEAYCRKMAEEGRNPSRVSRYDRALHDAYLTIYRIERKEIAIIKALSKREAQEAAHA